MPCSSNLLGRIAALSLLATIGCSGAHECSMDLQVGTAEGSLVFVSSAAYQRARAEWTATLDGGVDPYAHADNADAGLHLTPEAFTSCPGADVSCVEVWVSHGIGLTFGRPSSPGTYVLRDLGAQICESIPFATYEGEFRRCADADGTLVVSDIASDHLEADLTVTNESDANADGPAASGEAHLSARMETITTPCGGGCGNMGPIGSLN